MRTCENTEKIGTLKALKPLLDGGFRRLRDAGIEDWQTSVEWLACAAFRCNRMSLLSDSTRQVSESDALRFEEMLGRRLAREPVQYILGFTEFRGLRLRVDGSVLIPRQETELLAGRVIERLGREEGARVLDIGTGSGCVALAVAFESPGTRVTACDISQDALRVAAGNASDLGLDVEFVEADVLDPAFPGLMTGDKRVEGGDLFDVVVSNPPYIPISELPGTMPEVRAFEPHVALFVEGGPIRFYEAIAEHALRLLLPGGWLIVEAHVDFAGEVLACLQGFGFAETAILPDLSGRDRIVEGRLPWV